MTAETEFIVCCVLFTAHSTTARPRIYCLFLCPIYSPPYATEEQAVKVRHLRRSVMEYSTFDWSKVPRAEQRRLSDKSFDKPQFVTTRFR